MFSMSLDHFAWTLKLSFVCNQLNTTSGGNLLENQYCLFHEIHNHNLQSQSWLQYTPFNIGNSVQPVLQDGHA